jgi:hypothetical protein
LIGHHGFVIMAGMVGQNSGTWLDESERTLWLAVLALAVDDVRSCALDSVEYAQAVEFLTGHPANRSEIADLLGMSADRIRRAGEHAVRARRLAEGLPEVVPAPQPKPKPAAPAYVPPVNRSNDNRPIATAATVRRRPYSGNPFSPFRRAAQPLSAA